MHGARESGLGRELWTGQEGEIEWSRGEWVRERAMDGAREWVRERAMRGNKQESGAAVILNTDPPLLPAPSETALERTRTRRWTRAGCTHCPPAATEGRGKPPPGTHPAKHTNTPRLAPAAQHPPRQRQLAPKQTKVKARGAKTGLSTQTRNPWTRSYKPPKALTTKTRTSTTNGVYGLAQCVRKNLCSSSVANNKQRQTKPRDN